MSFFSKFPIILHEIGLDKVLMRDISRSVRTVEKFRDNISAIKSYRIPEGFRADQVSRELYGHQKFHWVIYLVANISPKEWPLSIEDFEIYLKSKYGKGINNISHYLDENGNKIQRTKFRRFTTTDGNLIEYYENGEGYGAETCGGIIVADGEPISFRNIEEQKNDSFKNIKVLSNEFLGDFISDFEREIK